MKDNVFLILGGDNRSLYLGEYLEQQGINVCYYAFNNTDCYGSLQEAIKDATCIILPLPLTRDRATLNAPLFDDTVLLKDISALAESRHSFFGGQLPNGFCDELKAHGAFYCDYFTLNELSIYNAVPTAEGVVQILIEKTPITINGMKCAVTGYGRVGKVLAHTLRNLGAKVTVIARSQKAFAQCRSNFLKCMDYEDLRTESNDFDVIINTVPALVLGEKELRNLRADCLIIETASAPFGIDFRAANENALQVIKASSLPGKVAPKTAGEIIGHSILPIMKTRGLLN